MRVRARLHGAEALLRPGLERALKERFRAPAAAVAERLEQSAGARVREVTGGRVDVRRTDDRPTGASSPGIAFDPEFGALGQPERPWRARALADVRPGALRRFTAWLRESLQAIVKSG